MQRLKSILLLFAIVLAVFPWQMVCVNHPFGHDHHHEHGELSPCQELRLKKAAFKGLAFWPPMNCSHISSTIDDYSQTQIQIATPTIQMAAVLAVVLDVVNLIDRETVYILPPDPNCRSATLKSHNTLRGPPLV